MDIKKSAVLSASGTFRYELRRVWDTSLPLLVFVMLNPSTADADKDDATIRKCIGFATRFGYGGIVVVNLFAYRATDPKDLKRAHFPVGPINDSYILRAIRQALASGGEVVCAWGANANRTPRPAEVVKMLQSEGVELKCLAITNDGWPSHPLMLSYDRQLLDYSRMIAKVQG